jgi:hypothetical protein
MKEQDLTIVFQGPEIFSNGINITYVAIETARKQFPKTHIIFSTWSVANMRKYTDLNVEVLISEDPGSSFRDEKNQIMMNLQRQLTSTAIGISAVKTEFAIKIRSDLAFANRNILEIFNTLNYKGKRNQRYVFLNSRVVVLDVTSINPNLVEPLPFHPCDWFYAGKTQDLKVIFPIQMSIDEEEITKYYLTRPKPLNNPFPFSTARFHPESYIFSKAVEKFIDIRFDHLSDIGNNNIKESEQAIFNNLYIVSMKVAGVKSLKHRIPISNYRRTYSTISWQKIAPEKCSVHFKIDLRYHISILTYFIEVSYGKTFRILRKLL